MTGSDVLESDVDSGIVGPRLAAREVLGVMRSLPDSDRCLDNKPLFDGAGLSAICSAVRTSALPATSNPHMLLVGTDDENAVGPTGIGDLRVADPDLSSIRFSRGLPEPIGAGIREVDLLFGMIEIGVTPLAQGELSSTSASALMESAMLDDDGMVGKDGE